MKIKIGIVDDHQLFSKSLSMMLESFGNYEVTIVSRNGEELQVKMKGTIGVPEIFLIDVNMPVMDGIETTAWLYNNFPTIKLVALSQNDSERAILGMIKAGCCAYLLKDTDPDELERALQGILQKGFYNTDATNLNIRKLLEYDVQAAVLSEKEKIFLQHACSDMTYKHIAMLMNVSERTIDGYRESLFAKLNVQSRVGLCLEGLRREIVKL